MIGCLQTYVRKQPTIVLYFEFETILKFYNLEAWSHHLNNRCVDRLSCDATSLYILYDTQSNSLFIFHKVTFGILVCIPGPLNNLRNMLPTIRLSPLWSPLPRKYTKPYNEFKNVECILMSLSVMPRGGSVAHIYVISLLTITSMVDSSSLRIIIISTEQLLICVIT